MVKIQNIMWYKNFLNVYLKIKRKKIQIHKKKTEKISKSRVSPFSLMLSDEAILTKMLLIIYLLTSRCVMAEDKHVTTNSHKSRF